MPPAQGPNAPIVSKVDRVWEKAQELPATRGGRGHSPPRVREAPRRRQHGALSWTLRSRQDSAQNQEERSSPGDSLSHDSERCTENRKRWLHRRAARPGTCDRTVAVDGGLRREGLGLHHGALGSHGRCLSRAGTRLDVGDQERGRRLNRRSRGKREGGDGAQEPGVWSWSMGLSTRTEQPWPGERRQSSFKACQADDRQSVRPRATFCPGRHVRDVVDSGL